VRRRLVDRRRRLGPAEERAVHVAGVQFERVIWLKGFTCPNDILETIRVSYVNQASMVCSGSRARLRVYASSSG
jgi:hypothetical protein